MAYIDPWGPTLEAMSGVGTALQNYGQMKRQAELDRMAREDWEFKKAERERTLADALAQREALAKASKPYDVNTPNPEYEKYLAAHTPEALSAALGQTPKELKVPSEMGYEGLAYTSEPNPAYTKGLSDLALAQGAAPEQTLTTKVTPHPLKAQVEAGRALAAQGNPLGMAMMSAAQKSLHDELTSVVAIGDLDAAAKLYTDVSGVPTSATPKGQLKIETKDGVTTIVDGATLQRLVNKGVPLEKAAEASIVSLGDNTKNIKFDSPLYTGSVKGQGGRVETVQYKYTFPNQKYMDAWEKAGSKPEDARLYGGEYKQVNQIGPAPANIILNAGKEATGSIPVPVQTMLEKSYGAAQKANTVSTTFKPEYTAFGTFRTPKTIGDAVTALKKQYGDDSPAANWWMDYQSWADTVRKELYGSAFTGTEQREWDKSTVNPGMSADSIQTAINKRSEIAVSAYERARSGQTPSKKFGKTVEKVYPSMTNAQQGGNQPLPPKAGYKVQRNSKTGEYRYAPL